MEPKTCDHCGGEFLPEYRVTAANWAKRRFCSRECKCAGLKGCRRSTFGKERVTLEQRFWSKVNKDGPIPAHCPELGSCWIWIGARLAKRTYGYLGGTRRQKPVLAHRVSWKLEHGSLDDEICVLHRCDNPPCVNPAHLFLGTLADNNADRESKGRGSDKHGENNPNAKLRKEQVAEIFSMRMNGMTHQEIADKIGVVQSMIGRILRKEAWK